MPNCTYASIARVLQAVHPAKSDATYALLRMLADGRVHSAGQLAVALGSTRAGITNRVHEVEALGLEVFKVRGRGYRLSGAIDLLRPEELGKRLSLLPWPFAVEILDECESTNSLLVSRALAGAPHATVIACERQTGGRGRRGNEWLSCLGGSLAFSLLWRFEQGAGALSGLSLAVAVGAARAIDSFGVGIAVKWPNDLLLHGRKLGGILIEMNGESVGPSAAVIGVGVNVNLPGALLRRLPGAIDLAGCGSPGRTPLLAALLEHIAAVLHQFSQAGFVPFRHEWQARHAWQGRRVTLRIAERQVAEGAAIGVGEDGALLLRSDQGLQRFHSGELSLRPA